jgi:UDP-N-acetylmuramyl pentapeptide phosphotransferase/UDP-N-acetylglucosamine-1-phosphate transferase
MDGINGILSMESVLAAAAYCALFLGLDDPTGVAFSLVILGATAGFMPWNFPSGSIFMGDGGSATLGFLFAFLAVRLAGGGASLVAALLPLFPFLFDSSLTILLRMRRGERFFATPHRSHLYQRLVALGWSHVAVTSLWGLLAALCCAIALRYDNLTTPWQFAALSAVVGIHGTIACAVLWAHSRRTAAPARAENPGG